MRSVTEPCLLGLCLLARWFGSTLYFCSPRSSHNTNYAYSETGFFRASVAVEHSIIERTTMACKVEVLVPLTVNWKMKHLLHCLVFSTQRRRRRGQWNEMLGSTANTVSLVPLMSTGEKHLRPLCDRVFWDWWLMFSLTSRWRSELPNFENVVQVWTCYFSAWTK